MGARGSSHRSATAEKRFRQLYVRIASRSSLWPASVSARCYDERKRAFVLDIGTDRLQRPLSLLVFLVYDQICGERRVAETAYFTFAALAGVDKRVPLYFDNDVLHRRKFVSLDFGVERLLAELELAILWAYVHLFARADMTSMIPSPVSAFRHPVNANCK